MRAYLLFFAALIGAALGRELQSSAPRVIAEAYECDDQNQEIQEGEPREIGYEIRICIAPNTPTRLRDVYVRSIEDFTFFRVGGGASQNAIEKRAEVDTDTILLCLPGSLVCSFKTRLLDQLFYDNVNGTISASGEVNMQFGTGSAARMLRTQVVPRGLQVAGAQGGFAGISSVKMEFPVINAGRPDKSTVTSEDADNRWADAPSWLKILIVVGGVAVVLFGCGACCMCCLILRQSRDRGKNEDYELRSARISYEEEPFQSHWEGSDHSIGGDGNEENSTGTYSSSSEKDEENHRPPSRRFVKPPQSRRALPPQAEEPSSGQETEESSFGQETKLPPQAKQSSGQETEELPPEPRDMDVCFDADEHPGTQALIKALKSSLRKFRDTEYGPPVYRFIKKQLPDRRFFFLCEDGGAPDVWREVTKKELIELVGVQFDAVKKATFFSEAGKSTSGEETELPPQAQESSGEETEELPPGPRDMDICFDADEHPGTQALIKALKSSLRKFRDTEYGPPVYRFIKKQVPDRRFFVCDDEDAPDVWREVTKKELIELVGVQFDAAKKATFFFDAAKKATFKKPTKKKTSKNDVVAFWSKGPGTPSDEPVAVAQPV
jgi:hypothetical protein